MTGGINHIQSTYDEDHTRLYFPACGHLEPPYNGHWHDVECQIGEEKGQRPESGEQGLIDTGSWKCPIPEPSERETVEAKAKQDRHAVGDDDCTNNIYRPVKSFDGEYAPVEHQNGHLDKKGGKGLENEEDEECLAISVSHSVPI